MSGFRKKVGMAVGAVAILSILSSTREQREAARLRMKRLNWVFALIALSLWAFILFG